MKQFSGWRDESAGKSTTLANDLSLIPSIHTGQLSASCSSRRSDPNSGLCGYTVCIVICTEKCTHSHLKITLQKKKFPSYYLFWNVPPRFMFARRSNIFVKIFVKNLIFVKIGSLQRSWSTGLRWALNSVTGVFLRGHVKTEIDGEGRQGKWFNKSAAKDSLSWDAERA